MLIFIYFSICCGFQTHLKNIGPKHLNCSTLTQPLKSVYIYTPYLGYEQYVQTGEAKQLKAIFNTFYTFKDQRHLSF